LRITIRLFASFRERAGTPEVRMELDERATLSMLLDRLESIYPSISGMRGSLLKSVNGRYAEERVALNDGDTVALMPPVSGG